MDMLTTCSTQLSQLSPQQAANLTVATVTSLERHKFVALLEDVTAAKVTVVDHYSKAKELLQFNTVLSAGVLDVLLSLVFTPEFLISVTGSFPKLFTLLRPLVQAVLTTPNGKPCVNKWVEPTQRALLAILAAA
jgi:hypothetical protein